MLIDEYALSWPESRNREKDSLAAECTARTACAASSPAGSIVASTCTRLAMELPVVHVVRGSARMVRPARPKQC